MVWHATGLKYCTTQVVFECPSLTICLLLICPLEFGTFYDVVFWSICVNWQFTNSVMTECYLLQHINHL